MTDIPPKSIKIELFMATSYIKAHRSAGVAGGGTDLLIGETIGMKLVIADRS